MRESIPRQVDKKPGVPAEEKGIWSSPRGGKNKGFFFLSSTFLSLSHIKWLFFSLSLKLMIIQQATQFKLCTRDYTTTMYPA